MVQSQNLTVSTLGVIDFFPFIINLWCISIPAPSHAEMYTIFKLATDH